MLQLLQVEVGELLVFRDQIHDQKVAPEQDRDENHHDNRTHLLAKELFNLPGEDVAHLCAAIGRVFLW